MARRNDDGPRLCRGCGAEILIIKTGTCYKNVTVDAEPVWVKPMTGGNPFFTADGRGIYGHEAGDADDDPDSNFIEAYIPHRGHCPNNGRAPRKRNRPSGYR